MHCFPVCIKSWLLAAQSWLQLDSKDFTLPRNLAIASESPHSARRARLIHRVSLDLFLQCHGTEAVRACQQQAASHRKSYPFKVLEIAALLFPLRLTPQPSASRVRVFWVRLCVRSLRPCNLPDVAQKSVLEPKDSSLRAV